MLIFLNDVAGITLPAETKDISIRPMVVYEINDADFKFLCDNYAYFKAMFDRGGNKGCYCK